MQAQDDKKNLTNLLVKVMKIQKEFAHEHMGAKTDRRDKIKKAINQVASNMEERNGN